MGEDSGAETPTTSGNVVTSVDIGDGNKFTVADIIAMKGAKEGLERDVNGLREANTALSQELEKLKTQAYNINQNRIQSDSAREAAEKSRVELEETLKSSKSQEEYNQIAEERDLLLLEKYSSKIDALADTLKIDKKELAGKDMKEIDIWLAITQLTQEKAKDPTLDRSGGGGGGSMSENALEANMRFLKDLKEGNRK